MTPNLREKVRSGSIAAILTFAADAPEADLIEIGRLAQIGQAYLDKHELESELEEIHNSVFVEIVAQNWGEALRLRDRMITIESELERIQTLLDEVIS